MHCAMGTRDSEVNVTSPPFRRAARVRRLALISLASLAGLYLALLVPDAAPVIPPAPSTGASAGAFAWQRDEFWDALERRFREARQTGCSDLLPRVDAGLRAINDDLADLSRRAAPPGDPAFTRLERSVFTTAPLVAGCPERFADFLVRVTRVRDEVKRQSRRWDASDRSVVETMYRLMYGGRAALEEVMLQIPPRAVPRLVTGVDQPSSAPGALILGTRVHSGDILVSRGGAATSALIARGNDFPGNFSHVALVHVDAASGRASVIEAHIERGVAVASLEQYLSDKKLRVMVLRLRSNGASPGADPLLPHRAASLALDEARRRHIAYDFAMDHGDPGRMFCSEVASAAYARAGILLWTRLSTVSLPGARAWLADFGVRHFETQEPSDLEYDPQLVVAAEWRDPVTLFKDHVDNAATEVLLEGAERGDQLTFTRAMLPVSRVLKAYSVALNLFGLVGPIPEGMTATAALKNRGYTARHAAIVESVIREAAAFERTNGYRPPYWRLVAMARKAPRE